MKEEGWRLRVSGSENRGNALVAGRDEIPSCKDWARRI